MEEANKLIGTGKKHLVMGKVVEAVSALQEACSLLAKKYGDTADECGEAFFWCGKALLDLARMENSVLGNALEGVPEEEEDEQNVKDSKVDSTENIDEKTRDELRVQVYDAMAEKKGEDAEKKGEDAELVEGKQGKDAEKSGDVEKMEAGDQQQNTEKEKKDEQKSDVNGSKSEGEDKTEKVKEDKTESGEKEEDAQEEEEEEEEDCDDGDAEMEDDAEEPGEGDAAADKDSEDEEVGNLQLSWEMLEVAKVIFKRNETKESQLMAAQTHLKLGEVSAESGNYTQALEDFQECLELQVKHLDPDSRLLAETHYQLGLTYSLNLQYSQAIEELKSSSSVIRSRLDKLQEVLDKAKDPEAVPEERKEMEELKALLPEIQEKVEDATEGLKTASAAAAAQEDGGSTSSALPGSSVQNGDSSASSKTNGTPTNGVSSTNGHASTAAVSDISHLVRKKRKPEESPVKEGVVKKVKQDAGQTNGVHKGNGET
ncbi:histone-binding protein N1/N2-like [Chelmon rostratus]|uniref:histone-binding protein N1/N2-like n=1 Tax=Chelmon rostratus TaxID=109905 RepID=UPI001BEAF7DD|nr:histone-binding protein N1/N2-like [Chelmon rostratus]